MTNMKKTILMLMLAAMSTGAMAEWVAIGSGEDYASTEYVDSTTIRRSGDMVKMWSLSDYKSPQKNRGLASSLSSKGQYEYDCKEERVRLLFATEHKKNMGAGDIVKTFAETSPWVPAPPGSIAEALWKVACGKK